MACASLNRSERGGSEKFEMKIYVSSRIRNHASPLMEGKSALWTARPRWLFILSASIAAIPTTIKYMRDPTPYLRPFTETRGPENAISWIFGRNSAQKTVVSKRTISGWNAFSPKSFYVPVQTIVSPYDAKCVTPLIYPTTDLDFLFGIIVSFDLSFYFYLFIFFFGNLHTTFFVNGIIPSL